MTNWLQSYQRQPDFSNQPDLAALFAPAVAQFNASTSALEQQWQLSRYRWHFNQQTSRLHWKHGKGKLPELTASAQLIGGFNLTKCQWEWAFASARMPKKIIRGARQIRWFGRTHLQPLLYQPRVEHLNKGQTPQLLAAAALQILNGHGVYQGQAADQVVFFVLTDHVRQIDPE